MINKNDLRKAISSIAISNAKRNTIYKAFSDLGSITKEEFDSVKSDISKVVESMLTKDTVGKANGVASLDSNGSVPIEQLGNIDTTLFLIVRELPTTDIKTNKIYLVPNQDGQGNNVYIEYLYVENVWEKLGEFKPEVDLSEYVKSNEIYQCIKKEYDSSKRGTNSIAIDDSSKAKNFAVALGVSATALSDYSIAIGYTAQAKAANAVVLGAAAIASTYYSIALGTNAKATGYSSITLGNASSIGEYSIAIGYGAKTSKSHAIAIGKNAKNDKSIFSVGFNGINGIDMDEDNYGLYLKGFGGYTGTNLTTNNATGEEVLNPDIKSVQQIINEKADASSIPTKLSQLTNDANFITSYTETDPVWTREKANYYTKTEIDNKGYLTEHQSLDDYLTKTAANSEYLSLGNGGVVKNSITISRVSATNTDYSLDLSAGSITIEQNDGNNQVLSINGESFNYRDNVFIVNETGFSFNNCFTVISNDETNNGKSVIILGNTTITEDSLSRLNSILNNITAATTTEDMMTKFNALLADLKAKGYMEADTAE
jgi:hypothetical protein|nr:MAG TPA: hypothetical protein [Crassvirales sp.]